MDEVMPPLAEDLSGWTLAEILKSETESKARSKELRLRTTALVNSRLSNEISREQYAISRKRADDDVAECKRGRELLMQEIRSRSVHSLPL
jgi:hypothetical protein